MAIDAIDERGITNHFGAFSIISAKLEFSRIWNKSTFFGAEVQSQNVLKFEIFPLSSFGDIIVQSRSGPTMLFAQTAGHNEPVAFRP